jgi:hypothetical protein
LTDSAQQTVGEESSVTSDPIHFYPETISDTITRPLALLEQQNQTVYKR